MFTISAAHSRLTSDLLIRFGIKACWDRYRENAVVLPKQ
jgi:hypothetical protein